MTYDRRETRNQQLRRLADNGEAAAKSLAANDLYQTAKLMASLARALRECISATDA